MDTSIVATAIYTIGVDLKSLQSVTWIALAYTLSYLGCAVIFARLADVFGRRDTFLAAFTIFFAFSLGCGFCQTLNQLIACRTLQGVGGSGLSSLTFVILPEISPPKMLQWITAVIGATVAMAGVLGPVLGGVITARTTWRWIFWINAPIGVVSLVLIIIAWPKPSQLRPVQKRSIRDLDFVGSFLTIAASVLVVFSFQQAGITPNIWRNAIFLAPILVGSLCWILLFSWEAIVARYWENSILTMFPLRLIKRRVYMSYVLITMMTGFPYFIVIYALPLRFQVVNGKSPLAAGVSLLPMLGSVAIGSTIGGAVNGKKNRICQTLFIGSCFLLIGSTLFATLLSNSVEIQPRVYGFQVFVGLGFGLTVSTVSLGAIIECDTRDSSTSNPLRHLYPADFHPAVAQGIISQVRILGGSIGIAASTAILGITENRELAGVVSPTQLADLRSSISTFTPNQIQAVREAYVDAFSEDLRVCAIVSGVCIFVTLASFRRNAMSAVDARNQHIAEEQQRLKGLAEPKNLKETP
jgi:MFS family permease